MEDPVFDSILIALAFTYRFIVLQLTIKNEDPVSETQPSTISDPIGLPLKVNAKLIHPVVTTVIWNRKQSTFNGILKIS